MSFSVHVSSAAELDVARAIEWYESQHSGLGEDFLAEFEAVMEILTETPHIYQELYRCARRVVMHRFPYLVWFAIAGETVTVVAYCHGKIKPATLRSRLR